MIRRRSKMLPLPKTHAACGAALALLLFAGARPAHAAGDWRFSITPYAWATDVGVSADVRGRTVVDEKIPVSDLLEDLDTIVQLRLEAMHRESGVSIDLFDVTLSDEVVDVALPGGAGTADLDSDMGMTILDVAGLYDPKGDGQGASFLYGVRVLNERATIDAAFETSPGTTVNEAYETDETYVDALFGARYTKRFTRHWGVQARADVSTGGTDFTYSVGPALSYAFGKLGQFGLSAGYRYMKVDFEDKNDVDTEMTLSGFLLGLRTSF